MFILHVAVISQPPTHHWDLLEMGCKEHMTNPTSLVRDGAQSVHAVISGQVFQLPQQGLHPTQPHPNTPNPTSRRLDEVWGHLSNSCVKSHVEM